MSGSKIEVGGHQVYHERYGTGKIPILILPGGTGSIHTDLHPLVDNMSKEKYTIIAMDPLGYGKSRPPARDYTMGTAMYKLDADTAVGLMKALGFNSFTWMGWSDGGRAGLVAAISYPSKIEKLIVWGAASEVTKRQQLALEAARDLKYWDEQRKQGFIQEYGSQEEAQKIWGKHVDFYKTIGNICKEGVPRIRCPTLVIHGDRDPVEQELCKGLTTQIADSQYHSFPDAGHSVHIEKCSEFVKIVEKFLDQEDDVF